TALPGAVVTAEGADGDLVHGFAFRLLWDEEGASVLRPIGAIIARPGPLPRQPERPSLLIGPEQHRAKRRPENRAVDLKCDVIAGTLANPLPRAADLGTLLIVEMDAVIGRAIGLGRIERDKHDCLVDAEQP